MSNCELMPPMLHMQLRNISVLDKFKLADDSNTGHIFLDIAIIIEVVMWA